MPIRYGQRKKCRRHDEPKEGDMKGETKKQRDKNREILKCKRE